MIASGNVVPDIRGEGGGYGNASVRFECPHSRVRITADGFVVHPDGGFDMQIVEIECVKCRTVWGRQPEIFLERAGALVIGDLDTGRMRDVPEELRGGVVTVGDLATAAAKTRRMQELRGER